MVEWLRITCSSCAGKGIVASSDYWNGPNECRDCAGNGSYYVSESDRIAIYPGGAFLGRDPGLYQKHASAESERVTPTPEGE